MTLRHQTLTFEREYDASPRRLFAAFADPRARERWAVAPGARHGPAATLDNLVAELARSGRSPERIAPMPGNIADT
ncbi:MAG TPA: hypothetical protein VM348_12855 [Brevundimonas sp.]|nr:hypothetical protein [Brevundimonas sp.]